MTAGSGYDRFPAAAGTGEDDWTFTSLGDILLGMLGMVLLLVLYLALATADFAHGDAALREIQRRMATVADDTTQQLALHGERAESLVFGTTQILRFSEGSGATFFLSDSDEPTARLRRILRIVRPVLARHINSFECLLVQGHTDSQSSSAGHSWALSARRAVAVVAFLTDPAAPTAIDPRRVLVGAAGYGEWYRHNHPVVASQRQLGFLGEAPARLPSDSVQSYNARCRRIDLLLIYRSRQEQGP